jgi:pimeloyl-ACP methyl ester carboxylesterase
MIRLAALALLALAPASDRLTEYSVVPSRLDPAVKAFDDPNLAIVEPGLPADAPLAVFLPGTEGKPAYNLQLMRFVARLGYRAIALSYDNDVSVTQPCTPDPDPDCASDFREMRVFGTGKSRAVHNPAAEAIVPRLIILLRALDRAHPQEGWGRHLDGDNLRWDSILLAGQSQGAGMAAWIAKRHLVRRVVLFSSPWETSGRQRKPAPWIAGPSVTPIARWQAAYNAHENTVALIRPAYAALGLPEAQIHVLALDLPPGFGANSPNPYHGAGIRDPRYAEVWRTMFGKGSDTPQ